VRVDKDDNIWAVDEGSNMVIKFNSQGRVVMLLGRRPEAVDELTAMPGQGDTETLDNGEIYKLELDGRIVGKFGRAGKLAKEFGIANAIDCRSENELLIGELANWRVQKVTLRASAR